ncbi:MAG: FAD-binding protein [Candidatus Kapabacteria bacterium]|nr:FAD-binding protein [Candidatus Kapabacteria bacterium]
MIKSIQLELKPSQAYDDILIRKIASRYSNCKESEISRIQYQKRSLDARNKKPRYILNLNVFIGEDPDLEPDIMLRYKDVSEAREVIIIGAGPAGYFAALEALEIGLKPIIFERGKDVRSRRRDLRAIQQLGIVDNNSNYCFGEGGAGTYSDGKLYTRSDKRGNVQKTLKIFVEHGAVNDILIDSHPHIGSDKLPKIIQAIRETILKFGGEINFNSKVTDLLLEDNKVIGVEVNNESLFFAKAVILATGHSSRDIYYLFNKKNIFIEDKPYAVGFRIEHPQELINEIQYGDDYSDVLPPAAYNLTAQVKSRGVFSFCMCPGGIIIPSVTNSKELVVNGMSMSARNAQFANSGIVSTVDKFDFSRFKSSGALSGLKFQENLERKFYTGLTDHALIAPAQNLLGFLFNDRLKLNKTSYIPGLIDSDIGILFPNDIASALKLGLQSFDKRLKGFVTAEANVIGLESRTSSPVRITRDKATLMHVQINGLFPAGEGAGYSGGIISSALDGQNSMRAAAEFLKVE